MKNASDFGFVKVAACSPRIAVANPDQNAEGILEAVSNASKQGAQVILLPELTISGYSAADLLQQERLLNRCEAALGKILAKTVRNSSVIVLGMPVKSRYSLYNCAVVIQNGNILGVVPKEYLPNYRGADEKRWFVAGSAAREREVTLCEQRVPFGQQLFRFGELVLGVEIGEDRDVVISPGSMLALAGANLIVNPSADCALTSKHDYRKNMLAGQSRRCLCAFAYASAGLGESTTDFVFSGGCLVAENGTILAESEPFCQEGCMAVSCIDVAKLNAERRNNGSLADNARTFCPEFPETEGRLPELSLEEMNREFNASPFIPHDPSARGTRCREIFAIQAEGLMHRMQHIGMKRAILGVSGGLDSTLAMLVIANALRRMGLPPENMICVTMPGFGTTNRTYQNALQLIRSLGAELREIDIRSACLQHMNDIGHDPEIHDVTYENTQARERTQILMDLANKEGALLVGTGDLSELAMGWCTYNGDHMSMYGVNASIPKTLVKYLVGFAAENADTHIAAVLRDVLNTEVSPELLPPDPNGKIQQKTEDTIGPYELHDFFLYQFLRFGFERDKIQFMAERAFADKYSEETIAKWLTVFLRRFFISQFKRSCLPDGPKVGTVGLSPRGDWKMPSDADMRAFLAE